MRMIDDIDDDDDDDDDEIIKGNANIMLSNDTEDDAYESNENDVIIKPIIKLKLC